MPAISTTRPVTTITSADVSIDVTTNSKGDAVIKLNGQKAIMITTDGYMRRLRGLTPAAGVRLLDDGRIAIKPKPADAV